MVTKRFHSTFIAFYYCYCWDHCSDVCALIHSFKPFPLSFVIFTFLCLICCFLFQWLLSISMRLYRANIQNTLCNKIADRMKIQFMSEKCRWWEYFPGIHSFIHKLCCVNIRVENPKLKSIINFRIKYHARNVCINISDAMGEASQHFWIGRVAAHNS